MKIIWHTLAASVRGRTHSRRDLPNQDSFQVYSGSTDLAVVSVADGHGATDYMRSAAGADFAAKAGKAALIDYLMVNAPSIEGRHVDLAFHRRLAGDRLPREIHRTWRQAVEDHLKEEPLTPAEEAAAERLTSAVSLYGTTLLSVLAGQDFIVYAQIGDGDILVVDDDQQVRRPIPTDPRLIGNETTSLATKNAWGDFYTIIEPVLYGPPAMVLVATDGYSNSFESADAFSQAALDIKAHLDLHGREWVEANLDSWLNETSELGSGDDTTLGLLWRQPTAKDHIEIHQAEA